MPIVSDHVEVEQKPRLGGGGPGKIPHRRGYGGGDDGDHGGEHDDFLSTEKRLRRMRLAMILCMVWIGIFFTGLTSAYVIRKGLGHWDPALQRTVRDWQPLQLPYPQLWINSLLLVMGSVTLELARRNLVRKAEFASMGIESPEGRSEVPWITATGLLGFGFLAGQIIVWQGLRTQGAYARSNPSSAFFYLLTGAHGVHLLFGMAALIYVLFGTFLGLRFDKRRLAVDATGWYWHFMGALWFYIFVLLYMTNG